MKVLTLLIECEDAEALEGFNEMKAEAEGEGSLVQADEANLTIRLKMPDHLRDGHVHA